jgi:SMC interacting uncharacterized protein involved in chromosome segregation
LGKIKFDSQLEVWLKKFKTKNHIMKGIETSKAEIDRIGGQIKENWKFDGQLRVQMNKLKTKDQDENDVKLWG